LRSTVVGVENPFGVSIIRPEGIEEFIKTAIPLIRDGKYVEKTGIVRAINWFRVANQRHLKIVPIMFLIFWIALEMLANAHAKAIEKEFIIPDNAEFEIVENKLKDVIENDFGITQKKRLKKLESNLRCINRIPLEHKIVSLFKEYGFKRYETEIKELKDFRNDVGHGNELYSYDFYKKIDYEIKLKRILEKLILSMLHFYHNEFVRPSIRSDDLLAS
jgi:hypothetical protein